MLKLYSKLDKNNFSDESLIHFFNKKETLGVRKGNEIKSDYITIHTKEEETFPITFLYWPHNVKSVTKIC